LGGGAVASADGLRFVVPVRTIHAGPNPKYFGYELGVTYYNLVSDQYTGLNTIIVPGTLRDSLRLLAIEGFGNTKPLQASPQNSQAERVHTLVAG
jgi:TnpA family transposase